MTRFAAGVVVGMAALAVAYLAWVLRPIRVAPPPDDPGGGWEWPVFDNSDLLDRVEHSSRWPW